MNVINLYQKCCNHGCDKPGVEYTGKCYECHRDGVERKTKINYAKVHRKITDYVLENWSRGKVTKLED